MNTSQARPVIRQGSAAPVFRGLGQGHFLCGNCHSILVENFEAASLVAIQIECFHCSKVSTTPEWPTSKPLPHSIVTLGSEGHFLVSGPVLLGEQASFTCDQEIERLQGALRAFSNEPKPFDLANDGLEQFIARLDVLTNGKMSRELGKARVAQRSGDKMASVRPLPWAVARIERQLSLKHFDLSSADGVSLNFLQVAWHLLQRWANHPLAYEFARGMIFEFHHAATMLTAASYMVDHGNRVGFTDVGAEEGSSPDLYIDISRSERVSIEVKAPPNLQWPNFPTTLSMERIAEAQLRSARKQITGSAGGVVVIGGTCAGRRLEKAIRSLVDRRCVSTKIAAVVTISYPAAGDFEVAGNEWRSHTHAQVAPVRNPKFLGPDYLRI